MTSKGPGSMWTVGHWTCPQEAVASTLAAAEITLLADVRKMPVSRRSPQFDAGEMSSWLAASGVDYLHLTELGGRRPRQHGIDPVVNGGWKNASSDDG